MAILRPVEERNAKGETTRVNGSITFKQDPNIRTIVGRHDWRLDPNPAYHPPITAQAQDGKVRFFAGVPDTTQSRALAKEMRVEDVPAYIIHELKTRPMRVREARPTVYEVKIATVGDVEVTNVEEIPNDGASVTVAPVAPNLTPRNAAPARAVPELAGA